ncbi:MAG TPA: ABC transporter permease [Gemmatimonadaceae bacterium]|nr:ABC transporter permease [Gemmatimonadaceae bacterium]
MQSFLRDIRYGVRSLIKSPGLALVATLALTLGIGLTTTMFSIVYGAMMKGLPFPDGDRIVAVQRSNFARGIQQQDIPILDFLDYKAQQQSFTGVAAVTSGTIYVSGDEKAERYDGSWITANTFDVLGVRPMLGRNFRAGEDTPSGDKVAIIAYNTWHDRFASDPNIVGKNVRVNGVPYTIVGVMPEGFAFPNNDRIWIPLQTDPNASKRGEGQFVSVFGKLKPAVSLDQANVDVATIAKRLAGEYKESNDGFTAYARNYVENYIGKQPRQLLYTMLGAVFFVLLIACANVANLLLDRAAHRTKEVGIRTALGASRTAVMRQFLAEAFVLSLVAMALGIGVAYFGIAAFKRAISVTQIPFFIDIRLHPPVLMFSIAIAFLTTLVAGAIPAYQSSRADINEILKDETRGASSFRIGRISKALVIVEIALSCGLLVAAGLMIKSVAKMRGMNPGFETTTVFTARIGFPAAYTDSAAQWRFFDDVIQRVAALPGVKAASLSAGLPGARQGFGGNRFSLEGKTYVADKDMPNARSTSISPGYFATLNTPLMRGRVFSDGDRKDTPAVVIVNQAFVRKFFPNDDALGRRIRFGGLQSKAPWATIVGIVGNQFTGDQNDPNGAVIYQPLTQLRSNFVYITARTSANPMALTSAVRGAVSSLNADIPLYWVQSLDTAIAEQLWFVRVFGTMFMIFGFVALFLASVGLYAVMSFSVSRRTREVGIRMALGAQGGHVVRMIFGQGMVQLGIGMAFGLAIALGISRLLVFILFDVQPRDPAIFGGVAAVLALVGLIACLVPARRATMVDPLVALRSD